MKNVRIILAFLLATLVSALPIETAAQSVKKLKQDIAQQESRINDLSQQLQEEQEQLASLRAGSAATEEVEAWQRHNARLRSAREAFFAREVAPAKLLADKPLTSISDASLDTAISHLTPYDGDSEVHVLLERLQDVRAMKGGAEEILATISSPYDASQLSRAQRLLRGFGGLSEAQQREVDGMAVALSVYPQGLQLFRELIAEVDRYMKVYRSGAPNASTREMGRDYVKTLFAKREADIAASILPVPFLAARFATYREAMLRDPLRHAEKVERDINE